MIAQCPTHEDLEAFALGAVTAGRSEPAADSVWIPAHLRTCEHCAGLVESLRRDNELLVDAAEALRSRPPEAANRSAGAVFRPPPSYALLHELGRGGQGVVYLAQQLPTRRRVAMKVLMGGSLATSRQRARFDREVELAAALRHPGIVTLHDSGVSEDGRPFLVMEYVDGQPLDAFADQVRRQYPERARGVLLALFVRIGQAVAYAHARGIIHRDLKPANIVVESYDGTDRPSDAADKAAGRPAPRILDFGLAKALHTEAREAAATATGVFAGTLAYAAPETLRHGVDTADVRADVYALGVILYELLTGHRPHGDEASVAETIRRITEASPLPPSARESEIDADLDTVVLRALSVHPDRRYQSVEAFIRDIERAMAGEPIEARRDSALYMLRKTARRHRVSLVAAGIAVIVLTAFSGALGILYQRSLIARAEADDRRIDAETQTRRAERLLSISLGAFSGDMEPAERRMSLADVAEQATARAEVELADDLAARARLYQSLAEMQRRAGNIESSDRLSRQSLADIEASIGRVSDEYIRALVARTFVRRSAGDYSGAEKAAAEAHRLAVELHGPRSLIAANTLCRLAQCSRARPEQVVGMLTDAVEIIEALAVPAPSDLGRTLESLGMLQLRRGRAAEAESILQRAFELRAKDLGPLHPRLFPMRGAIARALIEQGRDAEAEPMLQELYRSRTANRGGRQTSVVSTTRRTLAEVLVRLDRVDEALALWTNIPGRPAPEAAAAVARELLKSPGAHRRAEALLHEAIGEVTADTLTSGGGVEPAISVLGLCRARGGEHAEARALAEHAYEQLLRERDPRRVRDSSIARTADALAVLIEVCELGGDSAAADGYRGRLSKSPVPARADPDAAE